MARDAWFSDTSASSISSLSSSPYTWNLDWLYHLSFHRLLPSSRTYPSLRWVQEFVHAAPWSIKHFRDHPYSGLPCLGSNRSCHKIDILPLPYPPSCICLCPINSVKHWAKPHCSASVATHILLSQAQSMFHIFKRKKPSFFKNYCLYLSTEKKTICLSIVIRTV